MVSLNEICGDARALNKFVSAQQDWIRDVAKKYGVRGVYDDDLVQEGNIMLLEALKSYDEGIGTDFRTYASKLVKRRLAKAVRELRGISAKRIDDRIAETVGTSDGRDENDVAYELCSLLPDRQTQIVQMRYGIGSGDGEPTTMEKIAKKMGVSVRTVNRQLHSALETLREHG